MTGQSIALQKPPRNGSSQNRSKATDDGLHFLHEMKWLETMMGEIPRGSIHLIFGMPGSGKSTLVLQAAIDVAHWGQAHIILTEQTEERVRDRLNLLLEGIPKSKRNAILRRISFQDKISKVDALPDYVLGLISRGSKEGTVPDLLVVDSLQGSGLHPNSKSYEHVYTLFRICRTAGVTLFAIGHQNKDGSHSGKTDLTHSTDSVSCIRTCLRFRFFNLLKNRFGPTLNDPVVLEMDKGGRLLCSPHARPLAATTRTYLPGCGFEVEIQVSVGIPAFGESARIRCPGIPRARVSQVLRSLEQIPDLDLSLTGLHIDIQLVSGSGFNRTLLLPIVLATLASIAQTDLPSDVYFLGEMDLKRRIRKMPGNVMSSLIASLDSELLAEGSALVCPAVDAPDLEEYAHGVRIVGIDSFEELVEKFWEGNRTLERYVA